VLTEERHQYILEKLARVNTVTVQDLVEELDHSESTIRRDLSQLEEDGKLIRVHGGAKRNLRVTAEDSMDEKTVKNVHEKQLIAQLAANEVKEDEVIYLDAGTTTFEMIPYLQGKEVTVVTNGVPHASLLTDLQIDTVLIGGKIKQKTKAIVGSQAERQVKGYRFSKAFMGMNAVDKEYGYTTPDLEEAAMKQAVIQQANQPYVLVDPTKMGATSFVKVADIEDCALITTHLPTEAKELMEYTRVLEEQD
jgi:DeoR family fructose operon transcriptional repressor